MLPRIDHALSCLVDRVPTPFYLFDAAHMSEQVAQVKHLLGPETLLYYSMKANPNLAVVEHLAGRVDGVEVASEGELRAIRSRGIAADRIIYVGPGKSASGLAFAVDEGIGAVVADNLQELAALDALCASRERDVRIMVRVRPGFERGGYALDMSGGTSAHGIDAHRIPDVLARLQEHPRLRFAGLHCYLGSRVLDAERLLGNIRGTLALYRRLISHAPAALLGRAEGLTFDVGGGFGVPYFPGEEPLDLERVAAGYRAAAAEFLAACPAPARIAFELGSYLVAEAGYYVCRVLYEKRLGQRRYLVCEGGSHHNLNNNTRSMWEERDERAHFPIEVLPGDAARPPVEEATVVGRLCLADDLVQGALKVAAGPGDHLVIRKTGAYGLTDSVALLLSHAMPAEYLLDPDGTLHLVRRRIEGQELLAQTGRLGPAVQG